MRYRIIFIAGLGVGFVLGSRAGRERYEQLQTMARKVADSPAVQQAAGAFQAQAAGYAKSARGKLADGAVAAKAKVGGALQDRVPGMRPRDANGSTNGDGSANGDGRESYAPAPGTPSSSPEE